MSSSGHASSSCWSESRRSRSCPRSTSA
jgi:hypothetical protein